MRPLLRSVCRLRHLLLPALLSVAPVAHGAHYLGADVTYQCQGGINYLVTLTLYMDCAGTVLVPQDLSAVSDCGDSYLVTDLASDAGVEVSPLCEAELENTTCNGGALLGMRRYTIQQVLPLPACSRWVLSWSICCRGPAVNTAGTQGMYVETILNNAGGGCDDAPVFGAIQLPVTCVNEPAFVDPGVTDPDGDSLAFELVDARFYSGTQALPISYAPDHTGAVPVPGLLLDASTGHLTFTPTSIGNYCFALRASSFGPDGQFKGSVVRDFTVVCDACTNAPPQAQDDGVTALSGGTLLGPQDIGACQGSTVCFDAVFTDADAPDVLALTDDLLDALPDAEITVDGTNPVTAHICCNTTTVPLGDHVFRLSVTDGSCPLPHRQTYTYHLRVGGPTAAGPDVTICPGQQAGLNAVPANVIWTSLSGDPLEVGVNFSCNPCGDPLASPTQTTVYRVSNSGCTDEVTVNVLPPTDPQCLGTGIYTTDVRAIQLSPNPTTGHLDLDGPATGTFHVLDPTGRVCAAGLLTGARAVELPAALRNGPYVLRLSGPGGTTVRTARFELLR